MSWSYTKESDDVVFRSWSDTGGVPGLYKSWKLCAVVPHIVRRLTWLVNIKKKRSRGLCSSGKERKVKRHHIYLKMRLISAAGRSFLMRIKRLQIAPLFLFFPGKKKKGKVPKQQPRQETWEHIPDDALGLRQGRWRSIWNKGRRPSENVNEPSIIFILNRRKCCRRLSGVEREDQLRGIYTVCVHIVRELFKEDVICIYIGCLVRVAWESPSHLLRLCIKSGNLAPWVPSTRWAYLNLLTFSLSLSLSLLYIFHFPAKLETSRATPLPTQKTLTFIKKSRPAIDCQWLFSSSLLIKIRKSFMILCYPKSCKTLLHTS